MEGLSDNNFGFRQGWSTIDAIEKVLAIVNRNEFKPCRRRNLCVTVSIKNIKTFDTVLWKDLEIDY